MIAKKRIANDWSAEIARLWAQVIEALRVGIVGQWKVDIIRVTAICYPESERGAYLQRALTWIQQHPEEGL